MQLATLTNILPSGFSYVDGSTAGKLTVNPTVTGQNLQWNAASVTVPASGNIAFTFRASVDACLTSGSYTTAVLGTATQYVVTRSAGAAAVTVVVRATHSHSAQRIKGRASAAATAHCSSR